MGEGLDRCFPSGKLPRWGETGGQMCKGSLEKGRVGVGV